MRNNQWIRVPSEQVSACLSLFQSFCVEHIISTNWTEPNQSGGQVIKLYLNKIKVIPNLSIHFNLLEIYCETVVTRFMKKNLLFSSSFVSLLELVNHWKEIYVNAIMGAYNKIIHFAVVKKKENWTHTFSDIFRLYDETFFFLPFCFASLALLFAFSYIQWNNMSTMTCSNLIPIEMRCQWEWKRPRIHKQNRIFGFSDDWFRLLMWTQNDLHVWIYIYIYVRAVHVWLLLFKRDKTMK